MRILLASDHGGYLLKQQLLQQLLLRGEHEAVDLGAYGPESVDYPRYARQLCQSLLSGVAERGILLCGTGIGISIAANRYAGIRAALCHDEYSARLARQHNDANVLVLGGRTTGPAVAQAIVTVWLTTAFEGGRHQQRLDQIEHG
ncbi:MAG: ribose 5-phosphate isomerase B [Magnetococcales bacterium]|nr:ribose 5-phosphate isomerase B [Magnetococcales bacterium]